MSLWIVEQMTDADILLFYNTNFVLKVFLL